MSQSQPAWRCEVCGYVHHGNDAPENCPICGASQMDFARLSAESVETRPPSGEAKGCIVILGAGIAGIAAVESLSAARSAAKIVLISQEAELPYYRLNLTRYLAGEIERDQLPIHRQDWYQERRVQLVLGAEVTGLQPDNHTLQLRDGTRIVFERLLLAAGAQPFVPPIAGAQLRGVTSLRTIRDADYLLEASRSGVRCVCIGGGLLGLEAAAALVRRGAEVTLLEGQSWLLSRQLNARAGAILNDHVGRLGIKLRTRAATREILGRDRVEQVVLEDGTRIAADLVVLATGIRANTALAREAGLEVKQGVVVDDHLATSHADVLAAGDVAEHQGVIYGLWTAAQAQGVVAGKNLAGAGALFGGLPRATTLKVLGIDLCSVGKIAPEGEACQVLEEETEGRYFHLVLRESRLIGAILLGDTRLVPGAKKAIEDQLDCSPLLRGRPTATEFLSTLAAKSAATAGKTKPLVPARGWLTSSANVSTAEPSVMAAYRCAVCGYVYDEQTEGRRWGDLPADWTCPICGAARSLFEAVSAANLEVARPSLLGKAAAAHRVFGYVFLGIYLIMLVQMLPRLWTYQIEFPARTVVHIALGMAIGTALLLKIAIVRFFRRLEQSLVPALGTSLLMGSVVLIGISVPSVFKEALATRQLFTAENRERVRNLLAQTGLNDQECTRLATLESLRAGQRVLRQECIECHDLRTVLARPRTPESWRQTVQRMADRTTMLNPLEENEQLLVTAYLIAISPQLQRSTQQLRVEEVRRDQSQQAAQSVSGQREPTASYDVAAARSLFEARCSQCHETSLVSEAPPASQEEARELVARMVDEGLKGTEQELSQIVRYLTDTYVRPSE